VTNGKGSLAKVSRPRLYDAVARKRLFTLLDKHRQHPVIWVSGPPGSGKSTLIGSYIDTRKRPALWLQVDAGDADISTFFFYLGEAAKQLAPRRKRLPLLTPEHRADLPAFTRRFGRALFEQLPVDSMVVLDNFQEAAHDGLFQQVVSDLIGLVPETATLIVISRRDPEASFASHLANQTIVVLPWQELRLTEDEALALAKTKSMISPQLIKEAYSRANGWAAGLILMLESLKYDEQNLETLSGQSQEAIFAYFAQQTLNKADATAQRILAELSVLPSFTPSLARELTAESSAPDVLEYLFRNHLFTTRRFDTAVQYEFHPLFRAFLFNQLKAQTNDAELRELQRRAGRLLVEEGAIDSAIDLLLAAQDWVSAANVLQLNAEKLYGQGRFSTLTGWLSLFPANVVAEHPWLAYWQGTCTALTNFQSGRDQLEQAFDGFKQCGDKLGQILCAAKIIDIIYFQYENFRDFQNWLAELEHLDSMKFQFPSIEMRLQVLSAHLRAIVFYRPSSALRLPLVELLEAEITNRSDVNRRVSGALALVSHASLCGPLDRAQWVFELLDKLSTSPELAPVFRVYFSQNCSFWHVLNGNRSLASQLYERTAELAGKLNLRAAHFTAQAVLAIFRLASNGETDGEGIVKRLQMLSDLKYPYQAWLLSDIRLFIALKRQNKQAAILEIERSKIVDELGSVFHSMIQRAHAAIGYAMCGIYGEAKRMVSNLQELVRVSIPCYEMYVHFVRAFVAIQEQNSLETRDALRRCFGTAQLLGGQGGVTSMLGQTAVVLAAAFKLDIETTTARDWIRRMQLTCPDPTLAQWPWPIKIYTLGQFVVLKDDVPLVFAKKAPRRLLQLLKAIIVFGGENVPKDKLFEAIWPDDDAATASDALKVAISRLRLLLGNDSAIVLQGGSVSINRGVCWVDLYAFESSGKHPKPDIPNTTGVVELYKGELLPEEAGASWVIGPRERLRSAFLNLINEQARRLEHDGQWEQALGAYRRGIEAENLAESFYQGQMRCYAALNKRAEGQAVYRRLRQLLSITLGIAPAPASTQLFDRLAEGA
jgi:LuxR family transcriptional regulator, maltose regulon positive regulatory protein